MAEGPSVVELAQRLPDLHVIGLGAQDSLELAYNFIDRTGTGQGEIAMVWDPSFESWRAYGVRSQPYWILYSATGEELAGGPGAIDFDQVASLLA